MVVWQSVAANPWVSVPVAAVADVVELPALGAAGEPGPFSFADPFHVATILRDAGYADVDLSGHDMEMTVGGGLEFDATDQLWSVGVETYRMGAAFLRRRKLVDRARIVMQELMEKTGETANLGVAEDDCVVFVSQVETHQAIRAFFRPGTRSPFHASGIGKAVLAHLEPERVAAILRKAGLQRYTDKTRSDISALAHDLATIKHRGWSVDDEERHPGMRCVAAAIFDEYGEPIGGVSVSGPTVRVTPERLAEIGPLVRDAAAAVTKMIGGVKAY